MDIVTVSPPPDSRGGNAILTGELAISDDGGSCLYLGTDLRCRRRLFMKLDVPNPAPGLIAEEALWLLAEDNFYTQSDHPGLYK